MTNFQCKSCTNIPDIEVTVKKVSKDETLRFLPTQQTMDYQQSLQTSLELKKAQNGLHQEENTRTKKTTLSSNWDGNQKLWTIELAPEKTADHHVVWLHRNQEWRIEKEFSTNKGRQQHHQPIQCSIWSWQLRQTMTENVTEATKQHIFKKKKKTQSCITAKYAESVQKNTKK